MFFLIGLLCMNPADPSTCQTMQYGNTTFSREVCEETGAGQIGAATPFGTVVAYTCKPAGEPV